MYRFVKKIMALVQSNFLGFLIQLLLDCLTFVRKYLKLDFSSWSNIIVTNLCSGNSCLSRSIELIMILIISIVARNIFTLLLQTEERDIFEFLFVYTVIDNQLRTDNIQTQPKLYQSTGHLVPSDLIFVCEEVFLRVLRCVYASDEVVFNYGVDDASILSHPNILVITQADIARFVGVDCFDIHIG